MPGRVLGKKFHQQKNIRLVDILYILYQQSVRAFLGKKVNLINILDGTDRGQRVPFWKRSRADRYYLSRLVSERFFDSVDISSNNYHEVLKLSNNRDVSGVKPFTRVCKKPVEIPILTLLDNHYLKYQLNILLTSVTHHLWLFGLFIGTTPFI